MNVSLAICMCMCSIDKEGAQALDIGSIVTSGAGHWAGYSEEVRKSFKRIC